MQKIIIALALFALLAMPVLALQNHGGTYLAVFGSIDDPMTDWTDIKPDLIVATYHWVPVFDKFLDRVKAEGHGKHIVIDLAVHGWDTLATYKGMEVDKGQTHYLYDQVTMGYVVNHIEKKLAGEDVTVCCEACFGGMVYKKSIRGNVGTAEGVENCNHVPSFPIYGVPADIYGWNNVIYLQYSHNIHVAFVDLRSYEYITDLPERDLDENSDANSLLRETWIFLRSYAK